MVIVGQPTVELLRRRAGSGGLLALERTDPRWGRVIVRSRCPRGRDGGKKREWEREKESWSGASWERLFACEKRTARPSTRAPFISGGWQSVLKAAVGPVPCTKWQHEPTEFDAEASIYSTMFCPSPLSSSSSLTSAIASSPLFILTPVVSESR